MEEGKLRKESEELQQRIQGLRELMTNDDKVHILEEQRNMYVFT